MSIEYWDWGRLILWEVMAKRVRATGVRVTGVRVTGAVCSEYSDIPIY